MERAIGFYKAVPILSSVWNILTGVSSGAAKDWARWARAEAPYAGRLESYRVRRDERSEVGIRRLTVLAGILGPMTLLAGWWGANFDAVPGSGSQWGFGVFVGVQPVFAAFAVWFMIRRGLL